MNPVQGFKQGDGLIARRDVVGILRFNKKKKMVLVNFRLIAIYN